MKTRQRESSGTPGLPPAPAPPSRDANPWPMSATEPAPRVIHPRARSAYARRDESAPAQVPAPAPARRRRLAWIPSFMLVFVIVVAVRIASEAIESGEFAEAIGPLLAVAFAAFVTWRRLRRQR